jgi:hypothetical protein
MLAPHGRSWPEARATLQKIDSTDVRSLPIATLLQEFMSAMAPKADKPEPT